MLDLYMDVCFCCCLFVLLCDKLWFLYYIIYQRYYIISLLLCLHLAILNKGYCYLCQTFLFGF